MGRPDLGGRQDVIRINGGRNLKSGCDAQKVWEMILKEGQKGSFHSSRHCEEQSDEAIHSFPRWEMDCFATLAMT
jgi:hypothetical protein